MSGDLKVVHEAAYGGDVLSHPNSVYVLRHAVAVMAAAGDALHESSTQYLEEHFAIRHPISHHQWQ